MVRVVSLDFETYYERGEYSLRNMSTQQYINDPRFSIIGVAASVNGGEPEWHSSDSILDTRAFLEGYKLEQKGTITVVHNAMFDGAILEWQLGIKPWRYFCTMMGSRPYITPYTGKMSLASVSDYLGYGVKGTEVLGAAGKYRGDFSDGDLLRYAAYCCNDVVLCWKIFRYLAPLMPKNEMELLDLTIKKFTRPQLRLDKAIINEALDTEREMKAIALLEAGLDSPDELMSDPKFAILLQSYGVEVPMKVSATTGRTATAFAKSDLSFMKLLQSPTPRVRALVNARLKWKSTINETRLQRFKEVHASTKDHKLAVPLLYYGAHPGRFSGLDKLNLQNMGRKSALRRAVIAPPGYKVVAGDLSQIEARITATLAGQGDLVALFAHYDSLTDSDRDVYCEFGDKIYARTITKADETERFVAKTGVLSLGFQSGAQKFYDSMQGFGVEDITLKDAVSVVNTYRTTYPMIPALWKTMERLKESMVTGASFSVGPVHSIKEKIRLPNGMYLTYPQLVNAGGRYKYKGNKGWTDIYGGKLTENVVQALARIVMTTAEIKIAKAGVRAALSVHDELVYVIKEDQVDAFVPVLRKILTTPVPWMPELPINCEIGVGDNYGDAK